MEKLARVGEDHHAVGGERIVRAGVVDDVLLGNIFIAESYWNSWLCKFSKKLGLGCGVVDGKGAKT